LSLRDEIGNVLRRKGRELTDRSRDLAARSATQRNAEAAR
jgi:hypothetical protein